MVSLVDVVTQIDRLTAVEGRVVGWAGVGGLTTITVALLALLTAPRFGAGPSLALGAPAAVFGLAIGGPVIDDTQLTLALVMLGLGAAGLLGGAACMPAELPARWRNLTLAAYAAPLVAGAPVLNWLALHVSAGEDLRLTPHPPVWPLALVSVLIVSWSALTLLLEPARSRAAPGHSWDGGWTALVVTAVVSVVAVMLLGFEPDIRLLWLRPLVVVGCGLAVVGFALTGLTVPTPSARVGYTAAAAVALCWPPCVGLLLVTADAGATRVSALAVAVIAIAALVGGVLGWWGPRAGVVMGLLAVAGAAAGAWVMPGRPWLMVAAAAPMAAGAGAALLGGLSWASEDPTGVRFVPAATISALVVGSLVAAPLSWALGGNVPDVEAEARAAGRVVLGLTFALAVLAAAYSSTLLRGTERQSGSAGTRLI